MLAWLNQTHNPPVNEKFNICHFQKRSLIQCFMWAQPAKCAACRSFNLSLHLLIWNVQNIASGALLLFAQSQVCMSLQCGFSKAAERRSGDLHWQHKRPGLQQQGPAIHSTLLSAYPFHYITDCTAGAEEWLLFCFLIENRVLTIYITYCYVQYLFVSEYSNHTLSSVLCYFLHCSL